MAPREGLVKELARSAEVSDRRLTLASTPGSYKTKPEVDDAVPKVPALVLGRLPAAGKVGLTSPATVQTLGSEPTSLGVRLSPTAAVKESGTRSNSERGASCARRQQRVPTPKVYP